MNPDHIHKEQGPDGGNRQALLVSYNSLPGTEGRQQMHDTKQQDKHRAEHAKGLRCDTDRSRQAQPAPLKTACRLGATKQEWMHFSERLGLTADLLPTVCNAAAVPSPESSLDSPGKIPSLYNARRQYFGIKNWPEHRTTWQHIMGWSAEPDYGVCVRSRNIRAIDIDVDDAIASAPLIALVEKHLGLLPRRYREGVGRVLMPFKLDGPFPKRCVKVEGGSVEILGDGNHFVAAGTHVKSGTRYQWLGGLPAAIPVVTRAQFDGFWEGLIEKYATEPPSLSRSGGRLRGKRIELDDPVADFLRDEGLVLRVRKDGGLDIECPWGDQHTTGRTGDGSSTYFPAGTGGYMDGRFICMHASHGERSTREFRRAIGCPDYANSPESEFAGLDEDEPEAARASSASEAFSSRVKRPQYEAAAPGGKPSVSISAVAAALREPAVCGKLIAWDGFRAEVMIADAQDETPAWREIADVDNTRMREHLQRHRGFGTIPKELMRDTMEMVAVEHGFDSAQDWLASQEWDGRPRVEKFLARYFGAPDTPYTRAVARYFWTAIAGRVMKPGVKADMVLVAVGEQGAGKSRTIAAIAPQPEWFSELALDARDSDTARRLRGKVVIELAELSGVSKRDAESLKAMLSATSDEWVPKYKERPVRNPRRLLFFGSSNRDDFLADDTGHRRWLPFHAGKCDPDALGQDCGQLWAEALQMFKKSGVAYAEAERLAVHEHASYAEEDEWTPTVAAWLDGTTEGEAFPVDAEAAARWEKGLVEVFGEQALISQGSGPRRNVVSAAEVLRGALHFSTAQINHSTTVRVAKILKKLGWRSARRSINGARPRVFERPR